MPFYEIVVDCKGADAPVVSPMTYATLEEAEAALAPLLEILEAKRYARLSWFGADASNVRQAFVGEADERRPPDPKTLPELIDRMEDEMGIEGGH
jgi:hypothetical protein